MITAPRYRGTSVTANSLLIPALFVTIRAQTSHVSDIIAQIRGRLSSAKKARPRIVDKLTFMSQNADGGGGEPTG
jgi:hypothetical protein